MSTQKEGGYQVVREGGENVLKVNAVGWNYTPSIEDNANIMGNVIDKLVESASVTKIIFFQQKKFIYHNDQTQILLEIASIYNDMIKSKRILNISGWGFEESAARFYGNKLSETQYLILNLLRTDPIGCYVETKRIVREEKILLGRDSDESVIKARSNYIAVLSDLLEMLKNSRLIKFVENKLEGHRIGEREIYRDIFREMIFFILKLT